MTVEGESEREAGLVGFKRRIGFGRGARARPPGPCAATRRETARGARTRAKGESGHRQRPPPFPFAQIRRLWPPSRLLRHQPLRPRDPPTPTATATRARLPQQPLSTAPPSPTPLLQRLFHPFLPSLSSSLTRHLRTERHARPAPPSPLPLCLPRHRRRRPYSPCPALAEHPVLSSVPVSTPRRPLPCLLRLRRVRPAAARGAERARRPHH